MYFIKLLKYVGILFAFIIIYLIIAYLSKEAIFYYYKQHDKQIDWQNRYKNSAIKEKYKIIFILSPAVADREAGYRIIQAAKNLGWDIKVFNGLLGNEHAIQEINPDFILTNNFQSKIGLNNYKSNYKFYAILYHPISSYFSGLANLKPVFKEKKFPEVHLFDGFIISSPQISLFESYITNKHQKFHAIRGYASVERQAYHPVDAKQLVYMGVNWDKKRKGAKFSNIFKNLADRDNAVFYGPKESWINVIGPSSYKGFVQGSVSVVMDTLRKHGINLILHSNQHLKNATPSSRIFEATAAGVIGISDLNPFVVENFADNLLYIDTDKSADNILKQIETHLLWIRENPELVKIKTKNAFDIFSINFTLEKMLQNLAQMHEQVTTQ